MTLRATTMAVTDWPVTKCASWLRRNTVANEVRTAATAASLIFLAIPIPLKRNAAPSIKIARNKLSGLCPPKVNDRKDKYRDRTIAIFP